jgi:hypothetical protein
MWHPRVGYFSSPYPHGPKKKTLLPVCYTPSYTHHEEGEGSRLGSSLESPIFCCAGEKKTAKKLERQK